MGNTSSFRRRKSSRDKMTNIKIRPEDCLLVHKLLVGLNLVRPLNNDALKYISEHNVGFLYMRGADTNMGWDQVTRHSIKKTHIDLTDLTIPIQHTMILDGEEVDISDEAYNIIKGYIK